MSAVVLIFFVYFLASRQEQYKPVRLEDKDKVISKDEQYTQSDNLHNRAHTLPGELSTGLKGCNTRIAPIPLRELPQGEDTQISIHYPSNALKRSATNELTC
jgi:hypothetical protein